MNVEEILTKFKNGELLSGRELEYLVFEGHQVDEIEGDKHRWYRGISTILEEDGKYIRIEWNRGLTEYQDNEFYYQPYYVEPHEVIIKKKIWEKVNA